MKKKHAKMGFWMLTTLVAGNMIGSGVFLLPANLASVGSISLLSWGITAVGTFFIAIVFSRMSVLVPKTGGPYAYARVGLGRYMGFQTAYTYWAAVWIGNAAIALATIGYFSVFFPVLHGAVAGCIGAIVTVWILTFINVIGVRSVGVVQIVTTILKFIPLLLIGLLGWLYFHPEYLTQSFNLTHHSNFGALSHAATLTMWAFIGIESATVPAGSVENPQRNIPLATLFGLLIAAVVYISSSTALMGMIPAKVLAVSSSPFAAAAEIIFGHWGMWIIAAGATISCFGGLNGWVLLQGQIAMAAADDGMFPKIFAKRNRAGVPAKGVMITSACMSILLLLTISPNLVEQFKVIILMATLTQVVPYLYTAVSNMILIQKKPAKHDKLYMLVAILAAVYSFWIIAGAGEKIIVYGALLILSSVPLYALFFRRK